MFSPAPVPHLLRGMFEANSKECGVKGLKTDRRTRSTFYCSMTQFNLHSPV